MRGILGAGLVFVCALVMASTQVAAQGQGQDGRGGGRGQAAPLQNLQALPEDIARQDLTRLMRSFTAALGVDCAHCHTGTNQERFKDDLPTKAVARKMLQMSMAINNDLLKDVGTPAEDGALQVTCFTCHRGTLKPLTAPPAGGGVH